MSFKLIHFLRKLVGYSLTIELKDDTIMRGKCTAVDSSMNTHVRNVTIMRPHGQESFVESITIRGDSIRYIEIPNDINMAALLSSPPVPNNSQKGRRFVPK